MIQFTTSRPAGQTHSDKIAEQIACAIHEQRLEPGAKLGEYELSEIFGVSRTIVRSALKSLEHVQLVRIVKNRGAFVAKPTIVDAREVFEARSLLEPRMAAGAAARAGIADVATLRAHIAAEHDCLREGNTGRALYLSGHFHVELARLAGQGTIAGFVETLVGRSSLIISLYRRRQSAVCDSCSHERLIGMIEAGEPDGAAREMSEHIDDLFASLDLQDGRIGQKSLRDALRS